MFPTSALPKYKRIMESKSGLAIGSAYNANIAKCLSEACLQIFKMERMSLAGDRGTVTTLAA